MGQRRSHGLYRCRAARCMCGAAVLSRGGVNHNLWWLGLTFLVIVYHRWDIHLESPQPLVVKARRGVLCKQTPMPIW